MSKLKIALALSLFVSLFTLSSVYAADFENLGVTDTVYIGHYSQVLGNYPVITDFNDLNKTILSDINNNFESRIHNSISSIEEFKVNYKVTDANRYANITVTTTYLSFPYQIVTEYYVDKEAKTVITADEYKDGISAAESATEVDSEKIESEGSDITVIITVTPEPTKIPEKPAETGEIVSFNFDFALVALRVNAEKLGYLITWDAKTNTATLTKGEKSFDVTIGKNLYEVDGKLVELENAPDLIEGLTYVPVSFFQKSLGAIATIDKDGDIVISAAN